MSSVRSAKVLKITKHFVNIYCEQNPKIILQKFKTFLYFKKNQSTSITVQKRRNSSAELTFALIVIQQRFIWNSALTQAGDRFILFGTRKKCDSC